MSMGEYFSGNPLPRRDFLKGLVLRTAGLAGAAIFGYSGEDINDKGRLGEDLPDIIYNDKTPENVRLGLTSYKEALENNPELIPVAKEARSHAKTGPRDSDPAAIEAALVREDFYYVMEVNDTKGDAPRESGQFLNTLSSYYGSVYRMVIAYKKGSEWKYID
jgi:hypothetical protein